MLSLLECCSFESKVCAFPIVPAFFKSDWSKISCLCSRVCKATSGMGSYHGFSWRIIYFWASSSLEELGKKLLTMHGSLKGFSLADSSPRTHQRIVIEFFTLLNTVKADVPVTWKHFENLFDTCCLIRWWWEMHSGRKGSMHMCYIIWARMSLGCNVNAYFIMCFS